MSDSIPVNGPCWFSTGDTFIATTMPKIVSDLTPGFYIYDRRRDGMYYFRQELSDEPVLRFSSTQTQLFDEIDRFWSSRDKYISFGIPFKRGVLLTGAPGTGKSTVVRKALQDVISAGGFALQSCIIHELQQAIRDINIRHPTAPIVVVFEDLDNIVKNSDDEEILTNILDGVTPVENCLFIATTNYEQLVPDRLRNRPGRFDRVLEVGFPDYDTRVLYISQLLKLSSDSQVVTEYASKTGERSLAHVREYVIYREIYGDDKAYSANAAGVDGMLARVAAAAKSADKIALIKAYSSISKVGLADAKAWVERNYDKLLMLV